MSSGKEDQNGHHASNGYPKNIGILAAEVYFPSQYVCQSELEKFNNVSAGKYTIGLGQSKMGFCVDNEDINSICMTVVSNLMEKYAIRPDQIGRLEVGTETLIDKSKSVKSMLMTLFGDNTDVEGVDAVNACFGGTAAIFNAINWIESSYWDGRYALVVMGDLALYAKGPARPTGGAGAIAFLIGPDAPIVFERGLRATHITHAYDFYKPIMDSEYPIVDGHLSVVCYLNALERCYSLYRNKFRTLNNNPAHKTADATAKKMRVNGDANHHNDHDDDDQFTIASADAFLFHSPYCKLVQKSFARLFWQDYLEINDKLQQSEAQEKGHQNGVVENGIQNFEKFKKLSKEESFVDKDLEKELMRASEPLFKKKTAPALLFAKEVGNMYTPSLYACLASYLISKDKEALRNKRVVLFSYGSGLASAMFSLRVSIDESPELERKFDLIISTLQHHRDNLVHNRIEVEPRLYDAYLQEREQTNKKVPREARFSTDALRPGTWYLKSVDAQYRRTYDRLPTNQDRTFDLNRATTSLKQQLAKTAPDS